MRMLKRMNYVQRRRKMPFIFIMALNECVSYPTRYFSLPLFRSLGLHRLFRWARHSLQLWHINCFKITWSTENITRRLYGDNWRPWNWIRMRIGKCETRSWGIQNTHTHTHSKHITFEWYKWFVRATDAHVSNTFVKARRKKVVCHMGVSAENVANAKHFTGFLDDVVIALPKSIICSSPFKFKVLTGLRWDRWIYQTTFISFLSLVFFT